MTEPTLLDWWADKNRITEVIRTLFVSTDQRDWDRVRGCFASQVTFDMSSAGGGPPTRKSPEEIAAGWESGLRPIESVHHQFGNLSVSRLGVDEAEATCYGIAYHYRSTRSKRNTRIFVGSNDFHFERDAADWRIDLFRFRLKFVDGNLELEKEASG